jgi:hypothetical protein
MIRYAENRGIIVAIDPYFVAIEHLLFLGMNLSLHSGVDGGLGWEQAAGIRRINLKKSGTADIGLSVTRLFFVK